MKKTILILLFFAVSAFAQDSLQKVTVVNVNIATSLELEKSEVLEAIDYSMRLGGKHALASNDEIAEATKKIKNSPMMDPGPINIALETGSEKLMFAGVNRFKNVLRVDIALVDVADTSKRQTGYGYALLNFRQFDTDAPVIMPSLVRAIQRAYAAAVDSAIYENVENKEYRVFPAAPTVIAGLNYVDNDSLETWDIFTKKMISSYDAIEVIFEQVAKHKNYFVYDTETRDSVYAMFGYYVVENYNSPTHAEIDALRKFKVEYIITGNLRRIENGAELKLYLIRIDENSADIIKEDKTIVLHDSQEEFRLSLSFLTNKLLGAF